MRALLFAILVAATVPSSARGESPRWGSFDVQLGQYRPDIDSDLEAPGAYQPVFRGKHGWMFRLAVSRALFTKVGSLEAGLSAGFFQKTGNGQFADGGGASTDETKFRMIPTSAFLTYRFDMLADRYKIPLAPYARVALERYNWWVNDGAGDTSQKGATNGWSVAGGLALLLDILDPAMARELDNDSGVNHTYLFAEVRRAQVDDFGSSKSWNLSDTAFSGGLMFVF